MADAKISRLMERIKDIFLPQISGIKLRLIDAKLNSALLGGGIVSPFFARY